MPEIYIFLGTALPYVLISSTKTYVIDFRPSDTTVALISLEKFVFTPKWSRDPPKWAKKGLFGLFWRLFYNFLKIWSDDCFQNACICRHTNYLYTHTCVISEKKFGVRPTTTQKFENGPFSPILKHFWPPRRALNAKKCASPKKKLHRVSPRLMV